MKKIIKVLMVIALLLIVILSPLSEVKRASASAATEYLLNYYGLTEADCDDQTVVFRGGMAYYASKGNTATSGTRFKTIGVKITCLNTGETTSVALGGEGTVFSNESVKKNVIRE